MMYTDALKKTGASYDAAFDKLLQRIYSYISRGGQVPTELAGMSALDLHRIYYTGSGKAKQALLRLRREATLLERESLKHRDALVDELIAALQQSAH